MRFCKIDKYIKTLFIVHTKVKENTEVQLRKYRGTIKANLCIGTNWRSCRYQEISSRQSTKILRFAALNIENTENISWMHGLGDWQTDCNGCINAAASDVPFISQISKMLAIFNSRLLNYRKNYDSKIAISRKKS